MGLTVGDHQARKRKALILEGVAITVIAVAMLFNESCIDKASGEDYVLLTQHICRRLYQGSEVNCYDQLGLMKHFFQKFVHILCEKGRLHNTVYVAIKESLTMFLHVFIHNIQFRGIKGMYIWSTETISRHFLWFKMGSSS